MSDNPSESLENRKQKVDTFESSILRLTEEVKEISRKLDAIIKHLKIPYKPSTGFIKE